MIPQSTSTPPAALGQSSRLGKVARPLRTDASAHGETTPFPAVRRHVPERYSIRLMEPQPAVRRLVPTMENT